jgi:hypothetical protein
VFGFLKSKPTNKLKVMGHDVEVVLITRNGRVLFCSDSVKAYPKTHLEGSIFEVAFRTRSGNPYFAYYTCPDYYFAVVGPAGAATFGGAGKTEQFRSTVAQQISIFLVNLPQSDNAGSKICSFSHNRAHTNVLAYVSSLSEWHAIQHNDAEDEDASERKAARVNSGRAKITDVVSVHELSSSA